MPLLIGGQSVDRPNLFGRKEFPSGGSHPQDDFVLAWTGKVHKAPDAFDQSFFVLKVDPGDQWTIIFAK